MVPLGLWNDMRLPSFFSGVFFWPVSESKRGKTETRLTSIRALPLWMRAQEEKRKMDSTEKRGVLEQEMEQRK
ncbi:hypothetical protein INR49_026711, partial [Caranx melampygus]